MVYTDTASHGKASHHPQRGHRVTPAIAARDASSEQARRRFTRPGRASGRPSGAREQSHHEKPGGTRTRATLAACKAQQREHMSD
jgi:ribosomal protein S21